MPAPDQILGALYAALDSQHRPPGCQGWVRPAVLRV
jgi:hypothetical protein